jgi:hypothetical protein
MAARVFLLSPARCDGERAKLVFRDEADFALARALREPPGAELGEVFSFLSGLYFRGKLAYANAFARPVAGRPGALVITTDRGLVSPAERVRIGDLRAFACVDIAAGDDRYVIPMRRDVEALAEWLAPGDDVVLLGSIATGKYVDVLLSILGDRLLFPAEFVGRGDMSRGGLLLRCVTDGRELAYVPVAGAVRHGAKPPKLEPLRRR